MKIYGKEQRLTREDIFLGMFRLCIGLTLVINRSL